MKRDERLTTKGSNYYDDRKVTCAEEIYEQLKDLEDKIENGTLIELPCKVGDTLYFIYNRPLADKPNLTPRIHETSNWYFDIDKKGIAISTRNPYGYNGKYFYYLGEMVFLTKAEAEKKLKEQQNDWKLG